MYNILEANLMLIISLGKTRITFHTEPLIPAFLNFHKFHYVLYYN